MKPVEPVTGKTITDEQIRGLRDAARNRKPYADFTLWSVCDQALERIPPRASNRINRIARRLKARARCADAYNAWLGGRS